MNHDDYAYGDIWGNWEDIGPYYVEVKDRTLQEAAKHLERAVCGETAAENPDDPDFLVAVPVRPNPIMTELMVCDVEEGPCDDPSCPHTGTKQVYEFELWYRQDLTPEEEARRLGEGFSIR